MKQKLNIDNLSGKEWEELASLLSGERNNNSNLLDRFIAEDECDTAKQWKELKEMNDDREINVDKAWNKLYSRLDESGLIPDSKVAGKSFIRTAYFRIAATVLLLAGIGSVLLYMNNAGIFGQKTIVATSEKQKNLMVLLPDGSSAFLNRNSELSYSKKFTRDGRNVDLSGEAFFEIAPDEKNPFTVNAGKASIKVTGTSFNVITNNSESAVEVFVQTGQVTVTDDKGTNNLILEPGYIGIMNYEISEKIYNEDPNYMAWNTGILIYDSQSLDRVFSDLKRVYNMDIFAGNPAILEKRWTTNGPLDNVPQETVIRLICASFNLSYTKDGTIYHLMEK